MQKVQRPARLLLLLLIVHGMVKTAKRLCMDYDDSISKMLDQPQGLIDICYIFFQKFVSQFDVMDLRPLLTAPPILTQWSSEA
jgi:hypothetical protein